MGYMNDSLLASMEIYISLLILLMRIQNEHLNTQIALHSLSGGKMEFKRKEMNGVWGMSYDGKIDNLHTETRIGSTNVWSIIGKNGKVMMTGVTEIDYKMKNPVNSKVVT